MKNTATAFVTSTRSVTFVGLATLAWSALGASANAQSYTVTNLGTLGGRGFSQAYGINVRGQVTGYSTAGSEVHAFLYSNGSMLDLGTLAGGQSGGHGSSGYGINDSGQITGMSYIRVTQEIHAFLYSNGSMIELGIPGSNSSGTSNVGLAINARGQITGGASTGHAFLYSGGSMSDLGTLGGNHSEGLGINAHGQITGWSEIAGTTTPGATTPGSNRLHAFLYSNGSMIDLGTLGGTISSVGTGINARGQATGYSCTAFVGPRGPLCHAFLYSYGSMIDLGTPADTSSWGLGINDRGQITGGADTRGGGTGATHAFLYRNGVTVDLNTEIGSAASLYTLVWGQAINDRGQIVVNGTVNATGQMVALLLTPIAPDD